MPRTSAIAADLPGFAAKRGEVRAKELDGDLRPRTRKQMVDAVRDGLADLNINSGDPG
jgi:hypothetical protein